MSRLASISGPADRRPLPNPNALVRRAGTENFPVASRLLPARLRRSLVALYGYARFVDEIGDEAVGDRLALLEEVAADVARLPSGTSRLPAVRRLRDAGPPPVEPLLRLVSANRQDQLVSRYDTWADLVEYCRLSANPVGEVVLGLFGALRPDRLAWSDAVCTGLQLVEHLQDVGEDFARGRVYLPREDLDRFGCREADVAAATTGSRLREVVAFEVDRAESLLAAGRPLVASLHGWARIAVAGYVAGGLAAVSDLRRIDHDVLAASSRPRRSDMLRHATALLLTREVA